MKKNFFKYYWHTLLLIALIVLLALENNVFWLIFAMAVLDLIRKFLRYDYEVHECSIWFSSISKKEMIDIKDEYEAGDEDGN